MPNFSIHPNVYSAGSFTGLRTMLENIWISTHTPGEGTIYIFSGFANFNGGARFYRSFKEHTENGGRVVSFLGGSTSQRLSTKQVAEALLECGCEVNVINRKRLMHSKIYGVSTGQEQKLIVSSGNFTGPGMSQNVEASVLLDSSELDSMNFNWQNVEQSFLDQNWQIFPLGDSSDPGWNLLYDETPRDVRIDESEEVTLVVILVHADTARIQAARGTNAGKGSQYFWLSKDSFDFFPPLNIRNNRGWKGTLSTLINLNYIDLGVTRNERVTFEAENNLDFRLGTGGLRYSGIARAGDIACITRTGESDYELRIISADSDAYTRLERYAISFIGNRGKKYGYLDNSDFYRIIE